MNGVDKMKCDFVVRYGNDRITNRSYYDTYDRTLKEYVSIKLNEDTTWKQMIWEPLDKEDCQEVIKEDSVRVVEVFGMQIALPE